MIFEFEKVSFNEETEFNECKNYMLAKKSVFNKSKVKVKGL
jgi:hypothetical protein